MIALHPALHDYLTMRRALGYKLHRTEKLLADFIAFVEAQRPRASDHRPGAGLGNAPRPGRPELVGWPPHGGQTLRDLPPHL